MVYDFHFIYIETSSFCVICGSSVRPFSQLLHRINISLAFGLNTELNFSEMVRRSTANTTSINWLFEMVRRGTANTTSINCAFIGVLIFITIVSRPIDAHRQFQYHGASEATKELSHANSTNVVLLVNITLLNNAVSEGAGM